MGKMGFSGWESLVVFAVLVLCLEFWVSVSVALRNPSDGKTRSNGVRILSERGAALVLPLVGSERTDGRRGRALEEDARMTLHDDLLTKGCAFQTLRVQILRIIDAGMVSIWLRICSVVTQLVVFSEFEVEGPRL